MPKKTKRKYKPQKVVLRKLRLADLLWPPACDACGDQLKAPGALLFSPPDGAGSLCFKQHLCKRCYRNCLGWISEQAAHFAIGRALRNGG